MRAICDQLGLDPPAAPAEPAIRPEVVALARGGNVTKAIGLYAQLTGSTLAESRAILETFG